MVPVKHLTFVLAAFSLIACSENDLTAPDDVDPSFAKKVKVEVQEPEIQEFWVYANESGEQCIHFVVSGTFTGLGVNVAYDHFFNGYQDLYDHYEYYFIGGPPRADTEFREDENLGMLGHEDVCFNGERDSSSDPFKYFMDYPSTSISVAGEGGTEAGFDPIALVPAAITGETGARFFHPEGVVVGGEVLAAEGVPEVTSIWDHDEDGELETYSDVRSYAIWKGAEAPGNIYVENLSVPAASCTLEYGKGKDKNTVLGATVTLEVDFEYGAASADGETSLPGAPYYWGQGRIRILHPGALQGELSPEYRETPPYDGSRSYSWTFDIQDPGEPIQVEFVLDYLFASGSQEAYDWVYDPGKNGMETTAGYEGGAWDPVSNVSTELYDMKFPVAHSGLTTVVCN